MRKTAVEPPNFEDFRFSTPVAWKDVERTAADRTRDYYSTGEDGDDFDQRLAVHLTTPQRLLGEEVVVRPMPWSDDGGRPDNSYFDALFSEATGLRVVTPSSPGVDNRVFRDGSARKHSRLSPAQIEELSKAGSFQRVGGAIMRATNNATEAAVIDSPSYILTSSSMASALAAGMTRKALQQDWHVAGLTVAEPVNIIDRRLPQLGRQFARQGKHASGYLAMNPEELQSSGETMMRWLQRTVEAGPANWRYGQALARSAFMRDLGDFNPLQPSDHSATVYLTRGGGSKLSPEMPFRDVVNPFECSGVRTVARTFDAPHDHPYTMTVQSVVDAINVVREHQDR